MRIGAVTPRSSAARSDSLNTLTGSVVSKELARKLTNPERKKGKYELGTYRVFFTVRYDPGVGRDSDGAVVRRNAVLVVEAGDKRQRPIPLLRVGRHDRNRGLLALQELLQHHGRILVSEALSMRRQLLWAPAHLDAVASPAADRLRHDGVRQVLEGIGAWGGPGGYIPGAWHREAAGFPQEGVHPVLVVVSINTQRALANDTKSFGVLAY